MPPIVGHPEPARGIEQITYLLFTAASTTCRPPRVKGTPDGLVPLSQPRAELPGRVDR